ncbi:MAG: radical SAM protein [Clostridia bacterium]|nr:radical SAM protein [Clostridia bacterium]
MHYADYKTILSPQNGMNLYRGCTHGCIYCDSRSVCYQMKHDFEDIEVKRDAVRILDAQLAKKRKRGMIGTGAMCDPYIHLEDELRLTRQCLEVIEKHGFGLAILTKSARILRDLNLLKAINKKAKCVVQMTLTTYDEDLCRILEPDVSTTAERVAVLETMREAGIPTVVWMTPILPFINDTEENLRGLMAYCAGAGVRGIMNFGFGVTLREGDREYFYGKLDAHFPGVKARYIHHFGDAYVCNSPDDGRLTWVFKGLCREYGIISSNDKLFSDIFRFEEQTSSKQMTFFEDEGSGQV